MNKFQYLRKYCYEWWKNSTQNKHVRYNVESNVTMSMNNIIITMNQSYIPTYL